MTGDTATLESEAPGARNRRDAPLLYLYCILESDDGARRLLTDGSISGLEPRQPVFGIECDGLVAAVSRVPRATFLSAPLNRLISDLARVAPYALAHENAIRSLLPDAPALLPVAFGSVYRSRRGVLSLLREQASGFQRILARVRNRREWEVKLFCNTSALLDHVASRDPAPDTTPGRAYLLGLQRQRKARLQADETLSSAIDTVVAELSTAAAEVGVDRSPAEASPDSELVCRIASLVARRDADRFCGVTSALQRRVESLGLTLEVSGPWAPYSFVRESPAGAADDAV
jgi:hypothetical protein